MTPPKPCKFHRRFSPNKRVCSMTWEFFTDDESGSSSVCSCFARGCCARKNDPEFGESARPCIDLYRAGVLLDDNIVAQGETKAGPFAGWFRREEWIEHFFLHFGSNTAAVVANPDLDAVTEVSGRGGKGRLTTIAVGLAFTLRRRVEAVGNQVQKHPCDFLGKHVHFTRVRIKGPLQGDIEALFLGPRSVISEIETFFDEGVDIDRSVLARAFPRMQQHVLDDRI